MFRIHLELHEPAGVTDPVHLLQHDAQDRDSTDNHDDPLVTRHLRIRRTA